MRNSIFLEDIHAMENFHLDVLVSHEAPHKSRHGCLCIDRAAELSGARLIVHGQHNESYHTVLADGTRVQGLANTEILRLTTRR